LNGLYKLYIIKTLLFFKDLYGKSGIKGISFDESHYLEYTASFTRPVKPVKGGIV